jgi:hypothetical protein
MRMAARSEFSRPIPTGTSVKVLNCMESVLLVEPADA